MKKLIFISAALILLSTTSCKQYYMISDFEGKTSRHQEIAILPFEIFTFGHVPRNVDLEMLEQIESFESTTFQSSFFNKVLRTRVRRDKQMRVNVQHYSETNSILEKNGISIRESWKKSPEELAQLLGVDAVIKARVEKDQFFSDGLGAGIDVGQAILSLFSPYAFIPVNNKEVRTEYSIISDEGIVLWSIGYRNNSDWSVQAEEIVANINRRSVRHFPYRRGR